jgi:hypothetical protein
VKQKKWILIAVIFVAAQNLISCGTSTTETASAGATGNPILNQITSVSQIAFSFDTYNNLVVSTPYNEGVDADLALLSQSQLSTLSNLCSQFLAQNQGSTDARVSQEVQEIQYIQSRI